MHLAAPEDKKNLEIARQILTTKQETEEDMIKQYVKLFKDHTKTLSGITIGMVPLVGVPTPIPYPWVGLKCGI